MALYKLRLCLRGNQNPKACPACAHPQDYFRAIGRKLVIKEAMVYDREKAGLQVHEVREYRKVLHAGQRQLVCCGEPMRLMVENTSDGAKEKHVPVLEKTADGWWVMVGSILHPMEEKHYIEWIELISDENSYRILPCAGARTQSLFPRKGGKGASKNIAIFTDCGRHEKS